MFNNARPSVITIAFSLIIALFIGAIYFYYNKAENFETKYEATKTELQKAIFSHLLYISLSKSFSTIAFNAQLEKDKLAVANKGLRDEISKLLKESKNSNDYIDSSVSIRLLEATCNLRANSMSRSGQKFDRTVNCPDASSRLSYNNAVIYIVDLLEVIERANIDRKAVSDSQIKLEEFNKINSEKLDN
ncbi:hypothetical protein [Vibrio phage vB_VibM_83AMN]|nr:hypothetical protein [Vibrio phage vB_VibM_83AMN]